MIQYLNTLTGDGWLPASLDVVAKSSVLLVLASIACWLLRGCTAALRHRIWTIALAGCVAVPVVAVVGPQLQIPLLRTKPVVQKIKTSSAATVNSAECSEVGSGLTNTTQPQSAGDSNEALSSGLNATFSCASTVTADTGGISTDAVKAAAAVSFFRMALGVCCVSLIGAATLTAVVVQRAQTVAGTVRDAVTGEPVENANVYVLGGTRKYTSPQYPVRTDRRGKFRLIRTKEELDFTVVVDGDKHLYHPASRTFTNVHERSRTSQTPARQLLTSKSSAAS